MCIEIFVFGLDNGCKISVIQIFVIILVINAYQNIHMSTLIYLLHFPLKPVLKKYISVLIFTELYICNLINISRKLN